MNNYNGLQALYMCFFSKDLYRSVARKWKGIAFLYLFLLVMTTWSLVALKMFADFNAVIKGPVEKIIVKLPNLAIKDGELQLDKPSPYVLSLPKSESAKLTDIKSGESTPGEFTLVSFDATTDDIKGEENIPFLMTKHYFYVQSKDQPAQQYALKSFGDMQLSQDDVRSLVRQISIWVPIAFWGILGPLLFMWYAIGSLIFGAIGMAFGGAMNVKLTYGESVRIASVATTPAILFDTAVKLIIVGASAVWLLVPLLLTAGFTAFGVMANKGHIDLETSMPGGMPEATRNIDDELPPSDMNAPMV